MTLEFNLPDEHVASFTMGVIETLEQLGYTFSCDETSPPDKEGETVYKVFDVEKEGIKELVR